ncbi:MAG TPA: hypothetical protein VFZ73_11385 [Gemmatimonadaceae bacterium]
MKRGDGAHAAPRAAIVFLDAWRRVRQDRAYLGMKRAHLARTKPLATRRNR